MQIYQGYQYISFDSDVWFSGCCWFSVPLCDQLLYGGDADVPAEAEKFRNAIRDAEAILIAAHECPLG